MMTNFPIALIGGLGESLTMIGQSYPVFNSLLLMLSIAVPLILALALAVSGSLPDKFVRIVARTGFIIPGLISLWLAAVYMNTFHFGGYAFEAMADLGLLERFGVQLHLALNGVSLPFFVMAGIVGMAAGLYAVQSGVERMRLYVILLLIMQSGLMGVFSSVDVLFFYFFHEFALIPTFIMIALWGRAGRKAVALEVTIYLTLGAMITLAGLIALYLYSGVERFNMVELREAVLTHCNQGVIFGLLLIGFGILVSLFPFHSWAPRAYATAPAPAAMLHAGVLKKFGLYGLIQIAYPLLPQGAGEWSGLLLWLALGNLLIIGLVTICQRDLKLMLGNASVMHMGYAFLGLYAASTAGTGAAIMMLFAHGISVALLFLLADVIEKRAGTVDMQEIGGMGSRTPVLMGLFAAAMLASIGLPGFANFWGELGIFVSLYSSDSPWVLYPAVLGIIISAIYGLRAVAAVFFGEQKGECDGGDIRFSEKLPALLLLICLFVIGLWPRLVSDPVNQSVNENYASPVTSSSVAVDKPSSSE